MKPANILFGGTYKLNLMAKLVCIYIYVFIDPRNLIN